MVLAVVIVVYEDIL